MQKRNTLIGRKFSDEYEYDEWLENALTSDDGIEWSPKLDKNLYDVNLDMLDVRYVLRNYYSIEPGYGKGCHVIFGATLDDANIAIAVVVKVVRDKLKILKVWRE